ncbi:TetR/AcrR family transcriptional regulator [Corynebacterium vitaeruminis]|uniref:HTH tetR-type domain-containing protein n=1 Tax=Corynebacterium vitaeruminis DSM 20294 TaxID=1224164 RepID=W5Y755_9CORY|nr:TetR/AcrR family transcriptional regulator [Corynebacterium vitaeruminis]AHI22333.1 hypothetical protein B843_04720 [Corynebacterium vitaeruminis DSM 20294]
MAGLREQKKAQTRAAIARAAASVARYEGPEKQSIAEICAQAGVSQRTFHNYFSSREEAILEFAAYAVRQLMESVERSEGQKVFEVVEQVAISGLRRNDDDLLSFYSLGVLSDQVGFLPVGLNNHIEPHNQREAFAIIAEFFPNVDYFDLAAQIIAAASVAQFAVSHYFTFWPDADAEFGVNILRRAFDQFRDEPLAEPVELPEEVREDFLSMACAPGFGVTPRPSNP